MSAEKYLELLMFAKFATGLLVSPGPLPIPPKQKYRSTGRAWRKARLPGALLLSLLAICCTTQTIAAHAVLLESIPTRNGISAGPDVAIRLRFNVRIDAERSSITLIRKDGSTAKLQTAKQSEANLLVANGVGLVAGEYRIRWQVLASDGHLTSGEIPFSVAGR